ncbi:MAG: hypothetical protein M1827_004283 [Pycnora praestabilis]|nr:MAG: hypothetical protein M1827_004283 [Pycnora praestabilis]
MYPQLQASSLTRNPVLILTFLSFVLSTSASPVDTSLAKDSLVERTVFGPPTSGGGSSSSWASAASIPYNGRPLEPPFCNLRRFGRPKPHDCQLAWQQMELSQGTRLTVYQSRVWARQNGVMFDDYSTAEADYVTVPRSYSYGTCAIRIALTPATENAIARDLFGLHPQGGVTQDVASREAVKTAAGQVMRTCMTMSNPLARSGGFVKAGHFQKLNIYVFGQVADQEEKFQLNSIRVVEGCESSSISVNVGISQCAAQGDNTNIDGNEPSSMDTSTPQDQLTQMTFPTPPEVLCLADQNTCGYGFKCVEEAFVGTDVTWGLPATRFPINTGHCVETIKGFLG